MSQPTILTLQTRVITFVVDHLYLDLCLINLLLSRWNIAFNTRIPKPTTIQDTAAYKKQGYADQKANKDACVSVALTCIF